MRVGAVLLAVCVIGACGGSAASSVGDPAGGGSSSGGSSSGSSASSSGSSGDVTADGGSAPDARTKDAAREANAPGCPAQFSETPPQGNCTLGLACEYDEGACRCVDYCGGAAPPPDEDFSHWTCKKNDDCPSPKPAGGSVCKTPGKVCTYGDCCFEQFTCVGSKWSTGGVVCPP